MFTETEKSEINKFEVRAEFTDFTHSTQDGAFVFDIVLTCIQFQGKIKKGSQIIFFFSSFRCHDKNGA